MGARKNDRTKVTFSRVLNDASEMVVRTATPWAGVLWLLCMPLKFLQVYYLDQLSWMGETAGQYGD